MSEIKIYHGSDKIINVPEFARGIDSNDFGAGFYCTKEEGMAGQWACRLRTSGFINQYEIDTDGLTILNLNSLDYSLLNWLTFVLENRAFRVSSPSTARILDYLKKYYSIPAKVINGADIIVGYRADDSYFSFIRGFLDGRITYKQFKFVMSLGPYGEQFVIRSERAYERLRFVSFSRADADIYYPRRKMKDENARAGYWAEVDLGDEKHIRLPEMMKEEVLPDDRRLR